MSREQGQLILQARLRVYSVPVLFDADPQGLTASKSRPRRLFRKLLANGNQQQTLGRKYHVGFEPFKRRRWIKHWTPFLLPGHLTVTMPGPHLLIAVPTNLIQHSVADPAFPLEAAGSSRMSIFLASSWLPLDLVPLAHTPHLQQIKSRRKGRELHVMNAMLSEDLIRWRMASKPEADNILLAGVMSQQSSRVYPTFGTAWLSLRAP